MIKTFVLIFLFICSLNTNGQVISPWTKKAIYLEEGKITTKEGIYQGFAAYYGVFSHLIKEDKYTALPFLFFSADSNKKPLLLVFNGGPGITNFIIPNGLDSLLLHFNVLLPGYRGIDVEKTKSEDYFMQNTINLIVKDACEIVKQLNPDTVFVVGHSFGCIYSTEYIKKSNNDTTMAAIFSPIVSNNIYEIANNMEKMIFSYFEKSNCVDLYDTLLTKINTTKYPQETVMGLIYYLSNYSNFDKLLEILDDKTDIQLVLLNFYEQQIKETKKEAQKENLSAYLYMPENKDKTCNSSFIKQSIIEYFIALTTNKNDLQLSNHPQIKTFTGEYDYQTIHGEVIPLKAHYDVWSNAYKYIIQTYLQNRTNL